MLLDAGRTDVLADPIGREALHCIRCSACLNVCPVYERTGGHAYESTYPGPIGAILTPQLQGLSAAPTLPWASSLCGACYEVCPVKIDIPSVLVHLRGRVVRRGEGRRLAGADGGRAAGDGGAWRACSRAAGATRPRSGRRGPAPGPCRATARSSAAFRVRWRAGPSPVTCRCPVRPSETGGAVSARDEILGRIRTALADVPADEPPAAALEPVVAASGDVDRFAERAADYRATVVRVAAGEVGSAVAAACERHGARRLVAPDGLPDWAPGGRRARDRHGRGAARPGRPRHRRRRPHRPARSRSPRPARSSSTPARDRAAERSRSSPTCTSASSPPTASSTASPTPSPSSTAPPPRSRSSQARPPPPTSSSTASRECTARGGSRS